MPPRCPSSTFGVLSPLKASPWILRTRGLRPSSADHSGGISIILPSFPFPQPKESAFVSLLLPLTKVKNEIAFFQQLLCSLVWAWDQGTQSPSLKGSPGNSIPGLHLPCPLTVQQLLQSTINHSLWWIIKVTLWQAILILVSWISKITPPYCLLSAWSSYPIPSPHPNTHTSLSPQLITYSRFLWEKGSNRTTTSTTYHSQICKALAPNPSASPPATEEIQHPLNPMSSSLF